MGGFLVRGSPQTLAACLPPHRETRKCVSIIFLFNATDDRERSHSPYSVLQATVFEPNHTLAAIIKHNRETLPALRGAVREPIEYSHHQKIEKSGCRVYRAAASLRDRSKI